MSEVIGRVFYESAPLDNNAFKGFQELDGGVLRFESVLQDVDVPNRNRRIYPRAVIEEALQSEYVKEKFATNSLAGEANHPDPKLGLARQLRIDMTNVSHFIRNYRWEGNLIIGTVDTAHTNVGRDFAGMIKYNGMVPSFSMRGSGDVIKQGTTVIVKPKMRLVTWDGVGFPSHKVAYGINTSPSTLTESCSEMLVTKRDLAEYIASQSDNAKYLMESVGFFEDHLIYDVDSGVLRIKDNTDRLLAESVIEKNLELEYRDAMLSILR
ncbi:S80 family phage morphogenetic serine protease [Proteus mirabilis]|uniref:S80 family phage morphogenetic serine protease n=1 Tax=Proteus mirabilis TaxID=584 RepID=UPI0034D5021F